MSAKDLDNIKDWLKQKGLSSKLLKFCDQKLLVKLNTKEIADTLFWCRMGLEERFNFKKENIPEAIARYQPKEFIQQRGVYLCIHCGTDILLEELNMLGKLISEKLNYPELRWSFIKDPKENSRVKVLVVRVG